MPESKFGGQWILHNRGAVRIKCLASELFTGALYRVDSNRNEFSEYQPWMSSPALCKEFLKGRKEFIGTKNVSILDFSERYLSSIDILLNMKDKSLHSEEFNLEVFNDIGNHPKTQLIYLQAFELIDKWSPWQNDVAKSLLKSVVPLREKRSQKETGNAFSDRHFIGSIFTSVKWNRPYPVIDLNISFAHELGHQALMLYQYAEDLILENDAWIYSGVRKTLRPPVYALHAAVALAYMIECAQSLLMASNCILERAYLQECIRDYVFSLRASLNSLEIIRKSYTGQLIVKDLRILSDAY